MNGAGITSGNEVVALGILVNAVDVEIVPRVGGVVSGAGLARVDGQDCLCEMLLVVANADECTIQRLTVWGDMV